MHEMTFFEIMKISLVMPILLFLSVILVAILMERLVYFTRMGQVDAGMFKKIRDALLKGDIKAANEVASQGKGLLADALQAQLEIAGGGKRADMENILTLYYQRAQVLLGRRLGFFGTLSFICPLLGLLGTVLGVIRAFRDLALSGSGGPAVVAAGISEALIATAGGIAVAVTSALIFNYFNFRLKHILNSLNIFGQEIILMVDLGREI